MGEAEGAGLVEISQLRNVISMKIQCLTMELLLISRLVSLDIMQFIVRVADVDIIVF